MTPGKPDIHQRVAERIGKLHGYVSEKRIAAILAEEYGPIIESALVAVSDSDVEARFKAIQTLRAELSNKGLL